MRACTVRGHVRDKKASAGALRGKNDKYITLWVNEDGAGMDTLCMVTAAEARRLGQSLLLRAHERDGK